MFPLYNQLQHSIHDTTTPVSEHEKLECVSRIPHLQVNERELIFALIRYHQLHDSSVHPSILPYGGRNQKTGVKFDFDKFPNTLQHILVEFVLRYCDTHSIASR